MDGICQSCFRLGEVRKPGMSYNIGLIAARLYKKNDGCFCKGCIQKISLKYFVISLFLGWWGVISFFVNITCLLGDFLSFIGSFNMVPIRSESVKKSFDSKVVAQIAPHLNEYLDIIKSGKDVNYATNEIAEKLMVKPGHINMYLNLVFGKNKYPVVAKVLKSIEKDYFSKIKPFLEKLPQEVLGDTQYNKALEQIASEAMIDPGFVYLYAQIYPQKREKTA